MADQRAVVVIGGTSGLGMDLAERYAGMGRHVVISGRDAERTAAIAEKMGGSVSAVALDLAEPDGIDTALGDIGQVDRLALAGVHRDQNTVKDYDIAAAIRLATLKVVGYTQVIHALLSRFTDDASVVVYGGLAKLRPYVGSTTVTTVNAAVDGLVRTLAAELPPVRVNALHPGIVGDSPYWAEKTEALEAVKAKTPTGRLVEMRDVTDAATFLLENPSMHGVELRVDGGWSLP